MTNIKEGGEEAKFKLLRAPIVKARRKGPPAPKEDVEMELETSSREIAKQENVKKKISNLPPQKGDLVLEVFEKATNPAEFYRQLELVSGVKVDEETGQYI